LLGANQASFRQLADAVPIQRLRRMLKNVRCDLLGNRAGIEH
jgi:hypothetical protein